jgi:hypothetical protein
MTFRENDAIYLLSEGKMEKKKKRDLAGGY